VLGQLAAIFIVVQGLEFDLPVLPCVGSAVNETRAERSGRIFSSASRNATFTRTVAFWRSAAGTICLRNP